MAKNRAGNHPDQAVDILERGNIYFFYRPQVQEESPQELSDVQRFQFVLGPEEKDRYRLITVGKKRLPEPQEHTRYWGFVDRAGSTDEQIRDALKGEKYQTATRGERTLPAARPAG